MEVIEFNNSIELVAARDKGEIALFQIVVENPPMPSRYYGIPAGTEIPTKEQLKEHFTSEGLTFKSIETSKLPPPPEKKQDE